MNRKIDKDPHSPNTLQFIIRWLNYLIWLGLFILTTGAILTIFGMPWNTYWAYSLTLAAFILFRIAWRRRLSNQGIDGEPFSAKRQALRRAASFGLEPMIWSLLVVLSIGWWVLPQMDTRSDYLALLGIIVAIYFFLFLARFVLELIYARWR